MALKTELIDRKEKREELLKDMTNDFPFIDPKIAVAGLILSRYHYENGISSIAHYIKLLVKEIGITIKPYVKSFFHAIEDYERMFEVSDINNKDKLQNNFERTLKTKFRVNYVDLYDTSEVVDELADEAEDDPNVMSYYLSELHISDEDVFARLRRMSEDNPEEFQNILYNKYDGLSNHNISISYEKVDKEHLTAWLAYYVILRAIIKVSEPYQEALDLKAELLERRLKRERLLKDETSETEET